MLKNLFALTVCALSLLITSIGLCGTEKGSTTQVKPPPTPLPVKPSPMPLPDLVITNLAITGSQTKNSEGNIEVPIRVVIKNQGNAEAGIFKVSTQYTVPGVTYPVPVAFTVPGQSSRWCPYTRVPLAPGKEVSFTGKVTFLSSVRSQRGSLYAIADSCSGDEIMPDYCRVKEINELNNKSTALSVILPPNINLPTAYTYLGSNPRDSELGDVESDEANGIAHSDKYWFWSSGNRNVVRAPWSPPWQNPPIFCRNPELARTPRSSFTSVQKYGYLPDSLKRQGYNHFGDIDFYGNYLYVAIEGGNKIPIVAVYDENLNFVKYGKFPGNVQPTKAGWVAINPIDGFLYSHGRAQNEVTVYKRDFSNGGTLEYIRTIILNFKYMTDSWWNDGKGWNQGGAFSKNGLFYLVLDHPTDEDSLYTGIHVFKLEGSQGTELTLKSGRNNFINIRYNPDRDSGPGREEEIEGITIVNHGNLGQIHVIMLDNDVWEDDDVSLYHFSVNNDF